MSHLPRERLIEAWADHALGFEPAPDQALPDEDRDRIDLAAASIELALMGEHEFQPLPEPAARKLMDMAESWSAGRPAVIARVGPARTQAARAPLWAWAALAASLAFAILFVTKTRMGLGPAVLPIAADFDRFCASTSDLKTAAWGPFNHPASGEAPEVKGVAGSVYWSESAQRGYMKLANLPQNDPAREQYQLWIIDERGLGQRISGAVFNCTSTGEVIVPIDPRIPVRKAALFAITIEAPGGVWVSDMTRRVSAAALGG